MSKEMKAWKKHMAKLKCNHVFLPRFDFLNPHEQRKTTALARRVFRANPILLHRCIEYGVNLDA